MDTRSAAPCWLGVGSLGLYRCCFPFGLLAYGGSWKSVVVWWFSILYLWIGIECTYYMTIMLICLNVFPNFIIIVFSWNSRHFIDGMFVVALVATKITMSGVALHPFLVRLFMNGWCFLIFLVMVSSKNMSLQYAQSKNCMLSSRVGVTGGGLLYGWPIMHSMSGFSVALLWHL